MVEAHGARGQRWEGHRVRAVSGERGRARPHRGRRDGSEVGQRAEGRHRGGGRVEGVKVVGAREVREQRRRRIGRMQ